MTKITEGSRLPIALTAGLAVLMSLVAYAGHIPTSVAAHGIDKVLHFAMSFLLALALGRALRGRVRLGALLVFAVLALDEYLQRFSAHRSSDWGDLLADLVGCVLAVAIARPLLLAVHRTTERLR